MPINAYCGLPRSGKSFEVVSNPILDAVAQGRRVVTNVDGIDNDKIREYVAHTRKLGLDVLGEVVHVTNQDCFREDFLPYYDDEKSAHTDTIVQPGDLVCIDEAWRFWGTDCKLLKNHISFFLEHGHFTHPETGVACDLVLMVQDIASLHRRLKAVVAFSFRTEKKVSLGLSNTYSISMYEGWKQNKATQTGNWVRKYKKEIFPLYSSFKGGAEGKLVDIDKRQNILKNPKLWLIVIGTVLMVGASVWRLIGFFSGADVKGKDGKPVAEQGKGGKADASQPVGRPVGGGAAFAGGQWRLVGAYSVGDQSYGVFRSTEGQTRIVSPASPEAFNGPRAMAYLDGRVVTPYSAPVAGSSGGSAGPSVSFAGSPK